MSIPGYPTWINDTGTGEDGTALDDAFLTAQLDAIDAIVHGVANPTISASDIIDEVVDARGSMADLDSRLDVSLNEDGTLKSTATSSLVTQTQARASLLALLNMCRNGDLYDWSSGGAAAPDEFTLTGAGATVARTGLAMADTFSFNAGLYAAKITMAAATARLTEAILPSSGFVDNFADVRQKKCSFTAYVKSSTANQARIGIDDGINVTFSSYHTGNGATQRLTIDGHTVAATATKVEVFWEVNAAGSAYFGAAMFVWSEWAPSEWSPGHIPIVTANESRSGIVTSGTQNIGGVKSFYGQANMKHGSEAAVFFKVSGLITASSTTAGNVGAGATTLHTFTTTNGLDANNKVIRLTAWGRLANNANTKTITATVGGVNVLTFATAEADRYYHLVIDIIRVSATTCNVRARIEIGPTTDAIATDNRVQNTLAAAVTWANANAITTTGQSSAVSSNDIQEDAWILEAIG